METLIVLFLNITLTAVLYMAIPLFHLIGKSGKYEKKKAHRIALFNSILVGAVFFIINAVMDEMWNPTTAGIYYFINFSIIRQKEDTGRKLGFRKAMCRIAKCAIVTLSFWSVLLLGTYFIMLYQKLVSWYTGVKLVEGSPRYYVILVASRFFACIIACELAEAAAKKSRKICLFVNQIISVLLSSVFTVFFACDGRLIGAVSCAVCMVSLIAYTVKTWKQLD